MTCTGYRIITHPGAPEERVHCNGCAETASLRERLAAAERERDALRTRGANAVLVPADALAEMRAQLAAERQARERAEEALADWPVATVSHVDGHPATEPFKVRLTQKDVDAIGDRMAKAEAALGRARELLADRPPMVPVARAFHWNETVNTFLNAAPAHPGTEGERPGCGCDPGMTLNCHKTNRDHLCVCRHPECPHRRAPANTTDRKE